MRRFGFGSDNGGIVPYGRNRGFWPADFIGNFFDDNLFSKFDGGMKVDARETDNEYVLDVEVPGMKRDNIDIDVNQNVLSITVRVEDKNEKKEESGRYLMRERKTGIYQRSFTLDNVKMQNIDAKMENGILTIICPKQEPGNSARRIDIK